MLSLRPHAVMGLGMLFQAALLLSLMACVLPAQHTAWPGMQEKPHMAARRLTEASATGQGGDLAVGQGGDLAAGHGEDLAGHFWNSKAQHRAPAPHMLWKSVCSPALAAAQFQHFAAEKKTRGFRLAPCAEHVWLKLLAEHSSRGSKVFFDIGCNKGYEVVEVLQLWAPQLKITNKGLAELQRKLRPNDGGGNICGACGDCKVPDAKVTPKDAKLLVTTSIDIHCYELSDNSARILEKVRDKLAPLPEGTQPKGDLTPRASWYVHNRAVSDAPSIGSFSSSCSSEHCNLKPAATAGAGSGQTPGMAIVEVTSVDAEMERLNVTFIDMLKIDTEGNDPMVLLGAHNAFKEHRVGMLAFEYHKLRVWQQVDLQKVVHALSRYGMVCYMPFGSDLYRLTGCWDDGFEFKSWSNVFCVHAHHFLYPKIDAMSMYQTLGNDSGPV